MMVVKETDQLENTNNEKKIGRDLHHRKYIACLKSQYHIGGSSVYPGSQYDTSPSLPPTRSPHETRARHAITSLLNHKCLLSTLATNPKKTYLGVLQVLCEGSYSFPFLIVGRFYMSPRRKNYNCEGPKPVELELAEPPKKLLTWCNL